MSPKNNWSCWLPDISGSLIAIYGRAAAKSLKKAPSLLQNTLQIYLVLKLFLVCCVIVELQVLVITNGFTPWLTSFWGRKGIFGSPPTDREVWQTPEENCQHQFLFTAKRPNVNIFFFGNRYINSFNIYIFKCYKYNITYSVCLYINEAKQLLPLPTDVHAALQFTSVVYEDHSST